MKPSRYILSHSHPWFISQGDLSPLWPVICAVYLWKTHHLLQTVIAARFITFCGLILTVSLREIHHLLWTGTYCVSTGDSSPSVDWYLLYLYGRFITFITFCGLVLTVPLREIHHLLQPVIAVGIITFYSLLLPWESSPSTACYENSSKLSGHPLIACIITRMSLNMSNTNYYNIVCVLIS